MRRDKQVAPHFNRFGKENSELLGLDKLRVSGGTNIRRERFERLEEDLELLNLERLNG